MLYHWATGTFKLLILSQYYIDSSLDDKKVHEMAFTTYYTLVNWYSLK